MSRWFWNLWDGRTYKVGSKKHRAAMREWDLDKERERLLEEGRKEWSVSNTLGPNRPFR